MPADGAKIQVLVFPTRMLDHAASINLTFPVTGPIDDGFLQLVMAVSAEQMQLPIPRNPSSDVFHEFARPAQSGNGEPLALPPHVNPASFRF